MSQLVTVGNSLRQAFGLALVEQADKGARFEVCDCDVAGGTGADKFRAKYPDRFLQMGIAEQAAMGVAAGMALADPATPVVLSTFAVFGARAFEIFRLSVAYNRANVKLVLSHVGLDTGPDSYSAQSLEHYALWRTLPGVVVLHPGSPLEMAQAVEWMLGYIGPVVLLTGRSPVDNCLPNDYRFEAGQIAAVGGDLQAKVAILACGNELTQALRAVDLLEERGLRAAVFNVSTLKPIDTLTVQAIAQNYRHIFTVEDHQLSGGLFEIIAGVMVQLEQPKRIHPIAIMDTFGKSGEADELRAKYGLDAAGITRRVEAVVRGNERFNPQKAINLLRQWLNEPVLDTVEIERVEI